MIKAVLTMMTLLCVLGLGACNTVEGMGRDIERAGQKIQDF